MSVPLHGAWVDSPPSEVLKPAWWAEYRALGFQTAALMIESFKDGLDERWTDHEIAHAGVLARSADVELVLTFVPEPKRKYLTEFERRAPALCTLAGAAGLDMDVEGNWLVREVEGFENLPEAGVELVKIVRRFSRKLDVRLEGSTFTFHGENGPRAALAPLLDRWLPQAYAVRHRKDGTGQEILVPWEDRLGPAQMPHTTLDRALLIPGVKESHPRLGCGLAAYDQTWPGHDPEEAMQVAYDAAKAYLPVEIRWWSTKWILGPRANPYAARFLRRLNGTA